MSDIFSNAFNGISNAIHDVGKSSIGQMAEAAALAYFMGPSGLELGGAGDAGLSFATRAGLAGGITNLLNGGNIGSALQAGAMGYGLAGLSEIGETNPNAANVEIKDLSTESPAVQAANASGVNATSNVTNLEVPNQPQIQPTAEQMAANNNLFNQPQIQPTMDQAAANMPPPPPGSAQYMNAEAANPAPYNPAPSNVSPPAATPGQMALADNTQYANAVNPLKAAPQPSGNIFSKAYDYLTTPGTAADAAKTAAGKTSLYQDFKDLSPLAQAGLGLGAVSLLKSGQKQAGVNVPTYRGKLALFGGNPYSGPSNMYQVSAATGGLVALAKGGAVKGYAAGDVVGYYEDGTPQYDTSAPAAPAAPAAPVTPKYTSYTPQQITDYLAQNPGTNVALAEQQFNADPAAVNAAISTSAPAANNPLAQVLQSEPNNPLYIAPTPTPMPAPSDSSSGIASLPTPAPTGVPLGLQMIDQSLGASTPAQGGQIAIQNSQNAAYLNSIQNPTSTDISNFSNASQADQNTTIQKAVNAVLSQYGGDTPAAQKAISSLMDKWGVNTGAVATAMSVPLSTVSDQYNAVDPNGPMYNPASAFTSPAMAAALAASQTPSASSVASSTTAMLNQLAAQNGLPPGNYQSAADILNAIAAKKAAVVKPITPAPTAPATTLPGTIPMGTTGTTTTQNGTTLNTYTAPGTTTPIVLNPVNRTTENVSTPTDIATAPAGALPSGVSGNNAVINPNGTISQPAVSASAPGIQALKDAYTKAGGSLGYTNPAAPASTTDAGTQHYLDMLNGKIPFSKVPYTPTGEIAKPYYTSVMGMKENPIYTISQPYVFDPSSKTYVNNPNFDQNFSSTAQYIGAYDPSYTGSPVPALSQKTLDYLAANGVNAPSAAAAAASAAPSTNAAGQLTVGGKTYPTGSYVAGNGHLMVPDGGQDSNGNPSYTDMGVAAAGGGLMGLAAGGMSVGHLGGYSDGGRLLRGPGDGVSDSIPATIGSSDPEPARLADGEFVVPARIVSELGNGSTEAGARQLYKMMDRIQKARAKTTGKDRVATNTNANQYLPA